MTPLLFLPSSGRTQRPNLDPGLDTTKGDGIMSKTKSALLLSVVAVLSVGAMLASSASAAIKFEWKVGGVPLAGGANKEFTSKAKGTFVLRATLAGATVEILSSELEVEKGAKIIGGKPGTNEETVLFKNVTVDRPVNCEVESEGSPTGTVKTNLLHTEIVESEGTKEPVILFAPRTGTVFAQLLLLNKGTEKCGGIGPILASVTGSLLATPLPALTEVENGELDFEAPNSSFLLSNGTLDKAGLVFGSNASTLSGVAVVTLVSKEKYGAF
jgi:hypothetical protein